MGLTILKTPVRSPQANGIAERFVRAARSECLDWLLILNARHLGRTLTVFIDHYNGWRPHRRLDLAPPNGRTAAATMISARRSLAMGRRPGRRAWVQCFATIRRCQRRSVEGVTRNRDHRARGNSRLARSVSLLGRRLG
jgi:hypothetical protein